MLIEEDMVDTAVWTIMNDTIHTSESHVPDRQLDFTLQVSLVSRQEAQI
jgi:hypothetical protein